jgi:hypothetical protein
MLSNPFPHLPPSYEPLNSDDMFNQPMLHDESYDIPVLFGCLLYIDLLVEGFKLLLHDFLPPLLLSRLRHGS